MSLTGLGHPPQGGGGNVVTPAVTTLDKGTLALQAATTAVDIDFIDIDIAANQLNATDLIEIHLQGVQTGQNIKCGVSLNDTTSNPNGTEFVWATGGIEGRAIIRLTQSAQDTSKMVISQNEADKDIGDVEDTYGMDSGDDDLFTTAFQIRVSVFNTAAANARSIAYRVMRYAG